MSNTISPDFSGITVKWAGTYLDGSVPTGRILLSYNGGAMLDDDTAVGGIPVSVFPKDLSLPLTTTTVLVDGSPKTVAYCEAVVPASNDPDIAGSGGTYTFTEDFTGGRKGLSFVADIASPNGEIWLNKIAGTEPVPGETLSVVYYADFVDLEGRVSALEAGGSGTFDPALYYDKTATDSLLSAKADQTDLDATNTAVAGKADAAATQSALDAKADDTEITAINTTLAGKADSSDITTLQGEIDTKADATHGHDTTDIVSASVPFDYSYVHGFDITVDYVKAGAQHGTANSWPATRPGLPETCVNWKGPLSAGTPAPMIDGDDREYVS